MMKENPIDHIHLHMEDIIPGRWLLLTRKRIYPRIIFIFLSGLLLGFFLITLLWAYRWK